MNVTVELQNASTATDIPTPQQFQMWLAKAFADHPMPVEIVVRIVDEAESAKLNKAYRHKSNATNVLAFPTEFPDDIQHNLVGDLVICAPVVNQEVKAQVKSTMAHWAHITIHGALHLRGYDHQTEAQADTMEQLEIELLNQLGFPDPYILVSDHHHE